MHQKNRKLKKKNHDNRATICISQKIQCLPYAGYFCLLEGTARYAGFLLAPAKGFCQGFLCFWWDNFFLNTVLDFLVFFGVQ